MSIRQRAVLAEDKEERHEAILGAAERLLLRAPDRELNMAEVADESGLAKGTVYLYFAGKEDLLVALHERNVAGFFAAVIERLDRLQPLPIDEMVSLVHAHLLSRPLYLPLASRCLGVMAQGATPAVGRAFKERMAQRMQRAGAGLERHFPTLGAGGGVTLLRHSYALILGLWQLSLGAAAVDVAPPCTVAYAAPFDADVDVALLALWHGALGGVHAS